jgi:uncharacterized protein YbaP (TraB family)
MKRFSGAFFFSLLSLVGCSQKNNDIKTTTNPNSLLWKISGNGLEHPSYLFGTIHMLCKDDAVLSSNLKKAINGADDVYLEVDMDNMMEMLSIMTSMKMKGDTTFQDLMTKEDYELVKNYFNEKESMLPFSMLETFKPILAVSTLEQACLPCDQMSAMEEVIMREAKEKDKEIKGLETMSFQASMLDSIPYKMQADQLVSFIKNEGKTDDGIEMKDLFKAYKDQNLVKLEEMMTKADAGMSGFTDLLLYKRNANWVVKLKELFKGKSLVIAVGAGHLPGEKGVISLLKKEGYTVEPVENKMSAVREI